VVPKEGALLAPKEGAQTNRQHRPPDGPPIVLLHGGPGLWDYLHPIAAMLPGWRVHRFDQRGCGRSSGQGDYSIERAIADLEDLHQHWRHPQWAVFGHSWGATLALAYTWTHPAHVNSLIYANGVGPGDDWKPAYHATESARLQPHQLQRREQLRQRDRTPAETVELHTLSWCTDYHNLARGLHLAHQDAANASYQVNVDANRKLSAQTTAWPAAEVLNRCGTVTCPVLIMHGQSDPRPLWNVQRIADALPQAELVVIPQAGHQAWREQPGLTEAALTRFLAQQTPDGPHPADDPMPHQPQGTDT